MRVIFKSLKELRRHEDPSITDDMKDWFDGKTVRTIEITRHGLNQACLNYPYSYKGFWLIDKWFDGEYNDLLELFKEEL